jgi:hypothetical protein
MNKREKVAYWRAFRRVDNDVLLCAPCAEDAKEEGHKIEPVTFEQIQDRFTVPITNESPAHCSNCCEPIAGRDKVRIAESAASEGEKIAARTGLNIEIVPDAENQPMICPLCRKSVNLVESDLFVCQSDLKGSDTVEIARICFDEPVHQFACEAGHVFYAKSESEIRREAEEMGRRYSQSRKGV